MFSSTSSWTSTVSPLEILITRACNPSLPEPNYATHLEVAEYINQKKANTPREAAMLVARLVNHRNPHVAMLALALLETLVPSCGYAFHLQISTKEFLNELVRRFPERPPPFPGPVMSRILDLINDWKEGICQESRWKDDLGNIRDMHRLLTFKGYRFRAQPRQAPVASAAANLKSAEELENEDREAQEAKLQELIRRGTPRDLAAAQELMKALAGANPDAKPDYRTQALNELNKLESKVILLNEILDNVDTTSGEKFATGDVYDQVASILTAARPKIQGWISNAETDDPESLNTFLQINDQINTVLNRYEAYKRGDYTVAANPIPLEYGGSSSAQSDSLIDLDDPAPVPSNGAQGGQGGIDELMNLFGPSTSPTPQGPAPISLGGSNMGMGFPGQASMPSTSNGYGIATSTGAGSTLPTVNPVQGRVSSSQQGPQYGAIRIGTPQGHALPVQSPPPNYFSGAGIGSSVSAGSGASVPTGGMSMGQLQQHPSHSPQPQQAQAQGKDPFADLVKLF